MKHVIPLAAMIAAFAPSVAWSQSGPRFSVTPKEPRFLLHEALGKPESLKISGTFRPRIEGISGQFRPAAFARDDVLTSLLTTVFAEYDAGRVKIGGELFDSRGYFQRTTSSAFTTEVNALELGQAYLSADLSDTIGAGTRSSLTAGRFTQNIGSRRLVSRQQFRNTINAFTGIAYDWQSADKDKARLFWTMPHTRLPDDPDGILGNRIEFDRESPDLQFFGGSYTRAGVLGGSLEVYGYGLLEQDSGTGLLSVQTRDRRLFTPGIRLARTPKKGAFDYDVEAIYQTGLARDTNAATDLVDLDVSAYFVHATVGYTFDKAWSPRVALEYDQASGDGSNRSTYNRFDTLFGARRFEYGPTGLYGAVQRANLISPALRLEVTPSPTWDAFVAYRPLWLDSATDTFAATQIRDRSGASGRFAGQQIEARVRYWLVPNAMLLDTGVAYLIKGDYLKTAPNAPDAGDTFYGYLNTTVFF